MPFAARGQIGLPARFSGISPLKVEIYSDVACPWCYIGKRRFERAIASFPDAGEVDVVYRPFQLDPTAPTAAIPLPIRLEQKFGAQARAMAAHVATAAQGEGIEMHIDRGLSVNTFASHRLMQLVLRDHGSTVQRQVAEGLFDAYFVRGANVGDAVQLADIAAAAGLDRGRVLLYLRSDDGLDELHAELTAARGRGITAVPTFIFDERYSIRGAQPPAVLLQALQHVARELAAVAAQGNAATACVDGMCIN
ncbi:MAG: DsbA family oxidoreductase [Gemmatimonadaceae bacterium]